MVQHLVVVRAADTVRPGKAEIRVRHDQLGEGIVFQLVEEVEALRARQVVEPVRILQVFQLRFEDGGEGRAEHAAEEQDFFGQAADPEVDMVETALVAGIRAGAVDEVHPVADIGRRRAVGLDAEHEFPGDRALCRERGRTGDQGVCAVSGDEVHDRDRVLETDCEFGPVVIGFQEARTGCGEEFGARLVERGHAGITTAGDVDRGKVERQAEQIVA
ncbi:hypothetical protein D3C87_1521510 [compost metagenome]